MLRWVFGTHDSSSGVALGFSYTSSPPPPPVSFTKVMSGSCHFLIEAGRCLIPYNCTAGIYDVPNRGLQGTTLMCTNRTHPVDYQGNIPGEQPLECQTSMFPLSYV
jgi:hypothetical protein